MLVLLDNAVNAAQVAPLLAGSETRMVLVISRNRLPGLIIGYGTRRLSLDVLAGPAWVGAGEVGLGQVGWNRLGGRV